MSGINPGKYFIRFQPNPFGDLYATRQGIDESVRVVQQVPELVNDQSWAVEAGAKEGQWFITSFAEASAGTAYLSTKDPTGVPAGPLIAFFLPMSIKRGGGAADPDEELQQWIIERHEVPGVDNTYTLQPVSGAVGMSYYVGVKNNELYIQSFDLTDTTPRPYWRFDGISEPSDKTS